MISFNFSRLYTHTHRNWGFYSFNELPRENDNRSGLVPDQNKKDLEDISVIYGNGCFDEHGQGQALDLLQRWPVSNLFIPNPGFADHCICLWEVYLSLLGGGRPKSTEACLVDRTPRVDLVEYDYPNRRPT